LEIADKAASQLSHFSQSGSEIGLLLPKITKPRQLPVFRDAGWSTLKMSLNGDTRARSISGFVLVFQTPVTIRPQETGPKPSDISFYYCGESVSLLVQLLIRFQ
jgi:hypothetical protein